jgi:hypothetical protein
MPTARLRLPAALAIAALCAAQVPAWAADNRAELLANPFTYYNCAITAQTHGTVVNDPAVAANREAEAEAILRRGLDIAVSKGTSRDSALQAFRDASTFKADFYTKNPGVIGVDLASCALLGLLSMDGKSRPAAVAAVAASPRPQAAPPAPASPPSFTIVAAPRSVRGVMAPMPGSRSGGTSFTDERGWYRFVLAEGGTTRVDGQARLFEFPSGGQRVACSFVTLPMENLAKFSFNQIQAELDSLYPVFEPVVGVQGKTVLGRQTISLGIDDRDGSSPVRILGWDVREANGMAMAYGVAPFPAGFLVTACGGSANSHHREILEKFLRVGEGALIPGK